MPDGDRTVERAVAILVRFTSRAPVGFETRREVDALQRCHQNGGISPRACPMPSLTIKDLPDPLWARLRQRAARTTGAASTAR